MKRCKSNDKQRQWQQAQPIRQPCPCPKVRMPPEYLLPPPWQWRKVMPRQMGLAMSCHAIIRVRSRRRHLWKAHPAWCHEKWPLPWRRAFSKIVVSGMTTIFDPSRPRPYPLACPHSFNRPMGILRGVSNSQGEYHPSIMMASEWSASHPKVSSFPWKRPLPKMWERRKHRKSISMSVPVGHRVPMTPLQHAPATIFLMILVLTLWTVLVQAFTTPLFPWRRPFSTRLECRRGWRNTIRYRHHNNRHFVGRLLPLSIDEQL
mmetsp:Transcript_30960/g.64627  ORF Transcript_30960/g.64627 Transcript_30960/m.64627 type:complete len:261 (+) Transcript_30960:521-1303(+)